jgi:hypothetical protein
MILLDAERGKARRHGRSRRTAGGAGDRQRGMSTHRPMVMEETHIDRIIDEDLSLRGVGFPVRCLFRAGAIS